MMQRQLAISFRLLYESKLCPDQAIQSEKKKSFFIPNQGDRKGKMLMLNQNLSIKKDEA